MPRAVAGYTEPVSQSLQRQEAAPLERTGQRLYELGEWPSQALDRLQHEVGLPVLTEARARQSVPRGAFMVLSEDSFAIYKPWASMRELGREGTLSGDITLGPAVEGRVVASGSGSRVKLRIRRYAVPPSHRTRFGMAAGVFAAFVVLPLILGGLQPVALGLSLLSLFGGGAALLHRRSEREQDVRELLAHVERVLGPVEVGRLDDAPHRRIGPVAPGE